MNRSSNAWLKEFLGDARSKIGTDRVLFVRRLGSSMVREEFSGNFRDLADELLRTKIMSAKAGSGTVVELCQFQG